MVNGNRLAGREDGMETAMRAIHLSVSGCFLCLLLLLGACTPVLAEPGSGPADWYVGQRASSQYLLAVTHGDGRFVAVGAWGLVMTSPDGKAWTDLKSKQSNSKDIAYGAGQFAIRGRAIRGPRS